MKDWIELSPVAFLIGNSDYYDKIIEALRR